MKFNFCKPFILFIFLTISSLSISIASTLSPSQQCARLLERFRLPTYSIFSPEKPTVVIVDGYSSGRLMAEAFYNAGFQIIHIHSHGKPPMEAYQNTFWPESYHRSIPMPANSADIFKLLSPYNIVAVLPGADSGVLMADYISNGLHKIKPQVATNGIDDAHKDKFLMTERLKEAGLDHVHQIKTSNAEEALEWVRREGLLTKGPKTVVLKPLRSASGDGVTFVTDEKGIRDTFSKLVGKPDEFGRINTEILVQEYLEGDELVVNTTSLNDHHVVTDMWIYRKRFHPNNGKLLIYGHDTLLPFEGETQQIAVDYTLKVLAALNMKNGNGHAEIKMVPGRGPILVEMNGRMMGTGQPALTLMATGHSQLDRSVLSIKDSDAFMKLKSGYTIVNHAEVVTLGNFGKYKGKLNPKYFEEIKNLPGVITYGYTPGSLISPTVDLNSTAGDVWVLHEDKAVVESTRAKLREIEKQPDFILVSLWTKFWSFLPR